MRIVSLKPYWKIMMMSAREDRANPMRLLASVGLGVGRIMALAAIYKVAYATVHVGGLPYANALWGIAIYFVFIIGLSVRNVFKLVENEVVTGAVEVALIKPLDWRMVKLCQQLGKNLLEVVLIFVGFSVALVVLVGVPDVSYFTPGFVVGYICILLLAIVTNGALFLAVGLTAFWLNDAKSVYRIVDRSIMVFGGAFVPIALLPNAIQDVLRYSPLGVFSASTQLFNPALPRHMLPTLIASTVWSIVLMMMCEFVWRRAERRIEVNGG